MNMPAENAYTVRADGVIEVELTQEQIALVDAEDWERLRNHRWCASWSPNSETFYAKTSARRNDKTSSRYMHRLILDAQVGNEVDHINHDGLDNRRCNIRLCSRGDNQHNQRKQNRETTSHFKGVRWHKNSWEAKIRVDGKRIILGHFRNEHEAAAAYNKAARQYFGEFALLNGNIDDE